MGNELEMHTDSSGGEVLLEDGATEELFERRKRNYSKKMLCVVLVFFAIAALLVMLITVVLPMLNEPLSYNALTDETNSVARITNPVIMPFFGLSKWETAMQDKKMLHLDSTCYTIANGGGTVEDAGRCMWGDVETMPNAKALTLHTPTTAEEQAIKEAVMNVNHPLDVNDSRDTLIIPVAVHEVPLFSCPDGEKKCELPAELPKSNIYYVQFLLFESAAHKNDKSVLVNAADFATSDAIVAEITRIRENIQQGSWLF